MDLIHKPSLLIFVICLLFKEAMAEGELPTSNEKNTVLERRGIFDSFFPSPPPPPPEKPSASDIFSLNTVTNWFSGISAEEQERQRQECLKAEKARKEEEERRKRMERLRESMLRIPGVRTMDMMTRKAGSAIGLGLGFGIGKTQSALNNAIDSLHSVGKQQGENVQSLGRLGMGLFGSASRQVRTESEEGLKKAQEIAGAAAANTPQRVSPTTDVNQAKPVSEAQAVGREVSNYGENSAQGGLTDTKETPKPPEQTAKPGTAFNWFGLLG